MLTEHEAKFLLEQYDKIAWEVKEGVLEVQFGKCCRCNGVSSTKPNHHSVLITEESSSERNYFPQHAYDLCNECIEDLKCWLEGGQEGKWTK